MGRRPRVEALERRELLASYSTPEDTQLVVTDDAFVAAHIVSPPLHGTLSLMSVGGFAYQPNLNYNGPDRFTYFVATNPPTTNVPPGGIIEVPITVTPVNDAPEARNDEYHTYRNTTLTIAAPGVLKNDKDVDNNDLKAKIKTAPANGTLVLNENGGFTYAPKVDFVGVDSFTYVATDGSLESNEAKVWIAVRLAPTAVVANDDAYSTVIGRPLEIGNPGVLKNDHVLYAAPTDPATSNTPGTAPVNFPLTAKIVDGSGPRNGTVTLNPLGGFVYKPNDGFVGTDTFVYVATLALNSTGTVADMNALSDTATVTITVRQLPDARDDYYSVLKDSVLTVTGKGVLANDIPVRPEFGLTATVEKKPEHGELSLDPKGSFVYRPAAGYSGPDSFVYRATDATPTLSILPGDSDTATVYIYVRPNPVVVANPDFFETRINTALSVPLPGVLRNDYVLFVDPTVPVASDGPANGTPGTVNNLLKAELLREPSNGRVELDADGSFKYVPKENFRGTDTFTYQAIYRPIGNPPADDATLIAPTTDPNNERRDIATVTIHVNPLPLPIAHDDYYRMLEGTTLEVAAPGVLDNDRGVEGDELIAKLNSGVQNGELTLNEDGSFKYTPKAGFSGYDSFSYYALNENAWPAPTPASENATAVAGEPIFAPRPINLAVVSIYVHPLHPHVYALDDFYRTLEDTAISVEAPGVLKNDTLYPPPHILEPHDIPGTAATAVANAPSPIPIPYPNVTITAKLLTEVDPAQGELTFNTDGSFKFAPAAGFVGAVTFQYEATATINLPEPVEGDSIAAAALTAMDFAPCYLNADGAAVCPPVPDLDNIGTVTIYVREVEPPGPVARDDFYLTAANTTLGIRAPGVLANDYVRHILPVPAENVDLPAAGVNTGPSIVPTLYAVLVEGTDPETEGVLTLDINGSFKFEPIADFVGVVTFTYRASLTHPATDAPAENDGSTDVIPILSNIATVTIRIVPALAHNDSYTTLRDVPLNVPDPGVLRNDDGGSEEHPLSAILLSGPLHGELVLDANGGFVYTPDPNFVGSDVFVYRAESDLGAGGDVEEIDVTSDDPVTGARDVNRERDGSIAVVKIYVRAPHSTVHAYPDRYATPIDTALIVEEPGVLGNDFALVNHHVIAELGQREGDAPLHGEVIVNADGSFTYTPDDGFVGEDRFVYKAIDEDADPSNTTVNFSYATVVIHVLPDSTLPPFLPGGDLRTTDESGLQKIADWATLVSVGGDGKPEFVVSTDKPHLFAAGPAIDATGQLTYTPRPNASGQANVTVVMNNGPAATAGASATFTIQIDKPRALFNALKACDVTGDNDVAPDDALTIINYINSRDGLPEGEAGAAAVGGEGVLYYDVTGDGEIAPDDALMVINSINAELEGAPEREAADAIDASLLALIAEEAAAVTLGRRRY